MNRCLMTVVIIAVLLFCVSCKQMVHAEQIVVPDASASIEPEGAEAMWNVMTVLALNLQRGDSLIAMPITGDAGNDLSGRTLRETAPEMRERQAFDEDLKTAREKAAKDIAEMRNRFRTEQGAHTDLLGTFRVISEKVRSIPEGHRAVVVVLSDFIQDDVQFNFKSTSQLESSEKARAFALDLARSIHCPLSGVPVYLGYVPSKDLAGLKHLRRQAIEEFWLTFLSAQGAKVTIETDGLGSVQAFVGQAARKRIAIGGM